MTRIGIVSNPFSKRNRSGGMAAVRAVLARHPEVLRAELDKITDMEPIFAEFARREVGLIVVNGGDGTVQAALTTLLSRESGFDKPPCLAILPSGTTNVIALDVGLKGRPPRALARLLASGGEGERVIRRTLKMTYTRDGRSPIHGMFFGAGAFYRGTLLGREKIHPLGIGQSAAAGMALGLFLLGLLIRRRRVVPLVRDDVADLRIDGVAPGGKQFIALATTLDRLLLGFWPFWDDGRSGGFRYMAADFPPHRLGRALVPVLRGRPRPWMLEEGYVSGFADRLSFTAHDPVVLDGEFYTPEPGTPVVLAGGSPVEFLRG